MLCFSGKIMHRLQSNIEISAMLQALANPKRISLELLKHMLMTTVSCLPMATENFINNFDKVL